MIGAALWDHSGDRQRAEDGQADRSCGRERKRTCRTRHNAIFCLAFTLCPQCAMPLPSCPSLLLPARVTVGVRGEKTRIVYELSRGTGQQGVARRERGALSTATSPRARRLHSTSTLYPRLTYNSHITCDGVGSDILYLMHASVVSFCAEI